MASVVGLMALSSRLVSLSNTQPMLQLEHRLPPVFTCEGPIAPHSFHPCSPLLLPLLSPILLSFSGLSHLSSQIKCMSDLPEASLGTPLLSVAI